MTQQTLQVELERVLVVVAHPDDVDFGCAGSVAVWGDAGVQVSYCILTDGDAGGFDEGITRLDMARLRREEQTSAAAKVGVSDIHFLGHPDGKLFPTLELRRDISRVIRQVRPQRVVCQSPERNWQRIYASHPDHLACGEATLCAVYPDARNPFAHPELLEEGWKEHVVAEVWLMGGPEPDTAVDITDAFDRKVAALRSHVSQVGHREDLETMLREWSSGTATTMGMPEGRLAEAFRIVPTG